MKRWLGRAKPAPATGGLIRFSPEPIVPFQAPRRTPGVIEIRLDLRPFQRVMRSVMAQLGATARRPEVQRALRADGHRRHLREVSIHELEKARAVLLNQVQAIHDDLGLPAPDRLVRL